MPIQVKKLIYLNTQGLLNRTEDGAITNIGGTDRSSFTVGGKPVLLDYSGGGGPVIGNVFGHVHFQYSASTVWTIVHNKNSWHPVITTWNAMLLEVIPMQVQTVDENTVKIYFTSPLSGKSVLCFVDETSKTIDGTVFTLPDPNPPVPPNPVFVNTVNGLWGDVTFDQVNLIEGANIEITGTYPNLTITATGGSGGTTYTAGNLIDLTGDQISVLHVKAPGTNFFAGKNAGLVFTTGDNNAIFGDAAADELISGNRNTILGSQGGCMIGSGDDNVLLGFRAGKTKAIANGGSLSDVLVIDNEISNGTGIAGKLPFIEGSFDTNLLMLNAKTIVKNELSIRNIDGSNVQGNTLTFLFDDTGPGNVSVTWPATNGTAGQVLTNNGSGLLSWSTPAGGGGGGGSPNFTQTLVRGVDFTTETITVTHNLGKRFNIVQIYDDTGKVIVPDEIEATSINVTTLQLSLAFFGYSNDFTVVISPGAF